MRKRVIIVSVGAIVLLAGLVYFAIFFESAPVTYRLPDVSAPWQHRHVDLESKVFFFKGERLSVRVRGELDGTAEFSYGGKPAPIGPGTVSVERVSPEWWCAWCDLTYKPLTAKRGRLMVEVNID